MEIIQLFQPKKLVFGNHCFDNFIEGFRSLNYKKVFIFVDPNINSIIELLTKALVSSGIEYILCKDITNEPGFLQFEQLLSEAERNNIDSVIGIGGGSVMDVAKLIAAMCYSGKSLESVVGSGKISKRDIFLACIPTTSGTGSEVSPNAILLDEVENLKKGIISPFLIPDASYVDPVLTHSLPPHITASTGIDALTHCIEAYANKFSHPMVDLIALEGIALIYHNLVQAFREGNNFEAREKVSLGSLYGGMCLGPVNTAAVHALSYPLGSKYHIPHGVANALLLPFVLDKNVKTEVARYAEISKAIGVYNEHATDLELAEEGVSKIRELCRDVEIPEKLSYFNVPQEDVPSLAKAAFGIKRLLKNNPHEFTENEIRDIYYQLY
ncbi:MAG: iron-containing alcohol dehydrogenase [Bacteroidales bacterium]|nr:iron-containing alcohol dehydrogenase [Bacteroidales bacterium]MCF8391310.1 iron-containing alcohol dehydrogenase [Bacteroidales bacterium]